MTETGKPAACAIKKVPLTPKAIVHQRFGDKASYKVEEVQDPSPNGCPGLAIAQKKPCLFRCTLHLPEITVVSDTCKKKRDAEQSAAKQAIEKLGIGQKEYNPTVQEAWEDVADRLAFLFSNEFLSTLNPLSAHFKAALRREHHLGCVPVAVIAVNDPKMVNICKYINPGADANSQLVMSLIMAAAKLTDSVLVSDGQLSLQRKNPYPPEILSSVSHESDSCGSIPVEVICIPSSLGKTVESLLLNITATTYYLDAIACELGRLEASDILISRPIGKASSEMRVYSSAPKHHLIENMYQFDIDSQTERSLNVRASYLTGQEIYGDAIMASLWYTWKSNSLHHESVSLCSYFRMIVSMMPSGAYGITRNAVLAANLPSTFTTKNNWRGSLPRDVLGTFCRFHHLSEPVFSTRSNPLGSALDSPTSCKKLKVQQSNGEEITVGPPAKDTVELIGSYNCEVRLHSKNHELILECLPQESHRKLIDAVQSASLKVLHLLNALFENTDMCLEKLNSLGEKLNTRCTHHFLKQFDLLHPVHNVGRWMAVDAKEDGPSALAISGQGSGATPSSGSLASISYNVSLISEENCAKEPLESCDDFEFEIGNEAVAPHIEAALAQMCVGQSAYFQTELPPVEFILAAATNSASALLFLSSNDTCKLEYTVTLLQLTEPLEERMEQALFSPPLSKQRVEFAVQYIKDSSAAFLVDFGCGSGSLLDSLLSYPTSLEKIIGVDISIKGLARAAKLLHTKLNKLLDSKVPVCKIRSAVLYDGSITNIDSRLCGCDIATCLEVIEHMEEEDAWLFGDVALSSLCPKILIVSTPNYEYNVILQRSSPQVQDEDMDEKNQTHGCKFRNHDHKFEWTRAQFRHWASELAARHNYAVEFSGVGGDGNVDPGFASQIAIFRRPEDYRMNIEKENSPYMPIWEWTREDLDLN